FVFVRSDGQAIQAEFVDPDSDVAATGGPDAEPAAPPVTLAPMILAPAGTQMEFQALEAEYGKIERIFESAEWEDLKDRLSSELSGGDFWTRQNRFDTLARLALMDRVKAA